MTQITRVGADLAKRVIRVHAVDASGKLVTNSALARDKFVIWCAQLPAGCLVAMEASSSAHHWARKLVGLGLMPASSRPTWWPLTGCKAMSKAVSSRTRATNTVAYDVSEQLRTPEEMAAYLDAWLEEAPEDATGIARTLGDIARAKGMTQVARAALSRGACTKPLVKMETRLSQPF